MYDPKIEKQLRQLDALPREFKALAEWGWSTLRADIHRKAIEHGATPDEAAVMASRLARLVVAQLYGDIRRARTAPTIKV